MVSGTDEREMTNGWFGAALIGSGIVKTGWADAIGRRPGGFGEPSSQLQECYDASDFEAKTQDMVTIK
jgi:hypothetical protein